MRGSPPSIKVVDNGPNFVGPPPRVHPQVPPGSGFWSFAICVPNVISRSGQPSMADFRWLKDHGWKAVVNLRTPSEANWWGVDVNWWGLKELNFNYLSLPIKDNSVPTDKQVQEFLEFVTSPYNQPVHVYCHAGLGRTGIMICLYRYMIQGWPMFVAIIESHFLGDGINRVQTDWLKSWAKTHKPGSFPKKPENSVHHDNNDQIKSGTAIMSGPIGVLKGTR